MGMMLDPTPEMGEYSVEVRSESFYLTGADSYNQTHIPHTIGVYPSGTSDSGTVEIEIADIPKIRTALDQVEEFLKKAKHG